MSTERRTFASDILDALRASVDAEANARSAIELMRSRELAAHEIAVQLKAPDAAARVRWLAARFGVPADQVRAAIAVEVGRCRVRERAARAAVKGEVRT